MAEPEFNPGTATIIGETRVRLPGQPETQVVHGLPLDPPKKKRKYRNEPCVVDRIKFASKREASRYLVLKAKLAKGLIRNLELQPEYRIEINGELVCKYRADFRYRERITHRCWGLVVEDSKGFKTKEYLLKKKLMKAIYGIEILET